MSEPVIVTEGLTKWHGLGTAGVLALDRVSISVSDGEIVALRGPSGSGKSTLLNILGCLDRPTEGSYRLGSLDVSTLDRTQQAWVRLHFLGFIFQSFHLISDHTAFENVALPNQSGVGSCCITVSVRIRSLPPVYPAST